MIKSEFSGKTRIWRKDYENGPSYSGSLSHKKYQSEEWENAFIKVQFRKDVEVPNRTQIDIKRGFLDFYIGKDGKPVMFIRVLEFDVLGGSDAAASSKEEQGCFEEIDDEDIPF